jgi:trigger factor
MNTQTETASETPADETPAKAEAKPGAVRVTATEETPVAWTVAVTVGADRVRKAFDRAYRELARNVRMKGFRKGKVPRPLLEKLYAASVAEQLEQTLVQETLLEAIEQSGVEPVSEPAVEARTPAPGGEFEYTLRLEVKPKIELPDLTGLPAVRPAVEITDEEVDQQLEELRVRNAPLVEEPEGTQVEEGHVLQIDFVGRVDGEPFEGGSGQDVELEVGSGRFIPGFEEQLVGAVAGDDVEVDVTFPEDYGNAELAGKHAQFACHVASVKKRQIPELDDEFAKDLGDFADLDALRHRIRDELTEGRERESQQVLRRSLLDALVERTAFAVPAGLVERQLQHQLRAAHQRLHGQLPEEAIHQQLEQWREQWRDAAERETREMLILEAVAAAHEIAAEPEEVDSRLAELAEKQGVDPQVLARAGGDADLKRAIAAQLVDEKTLALLAGKAKVEETTDS